jgi:hypothetical protein
MESDLSCHYSDPSGKQLGVLTGPTSYETVWPAWPGLTNNDHGGKTLHFQNGRLVTYDDRIPPSLVYGKICEFWVELGEINSTLGYPLTDPQFLSDGTTCVIFEGGHVHQANGSEDAAMFVEQMHICLPRLFLTRNHLQISCSQLHGALQTYFSSVCTPGSRCAHCSKSRPRLPSHAPPFLSG